MDFNRLLELIGNQDKTGGWKDGRSGKIDVDGLRIRIGLGSKKTGKEDG